MNSKVRQTDVGYIPALPASEVPHQSTSFRGVFLVFEVDGEVKVLLGLSGQLFINIGSK